MDLYLEYIDTFGASHTELIHPKGWEDMEYSINRSDEFYGVMHEVITDLKFVQGAGYEIVNNLYEEQGLKASLWLKFTLFGREYKFRWEPETLARDIHHCEISCDFKREGAIQKVMSRRTTDVDVFNDTESVNGEPLSEWQRKSEEVTLNAVSLQKTAVFKRNEEAAQERADEIEASSTSEMYFTNLAEAGSDMRESFDPVFQGNQFTFKELRALVFKNSIRGLTIDYHFEVNIENEIINSAQDRDVRFIIEMWLTTPSAPIFQEILHNNQQTGVASSSTATENINISGSIDLSNTNLMPGDGILFNVFIRTDLELSEDHTIENKVTWERADVTVKAIELSTLREVGVQGAFVNEHLATIVESISDKEVTFKSDYYSNEESQPIAGSKKGLGSDRIVTSGGAIRNHPDKNLITNLSEAFRSLHAIDNIGLGFERDGNEFILRVEPIEYFFDKSVEVASFDRVRMDEAEIAHDWISSEIEIGYAQWDAGLKIKKNEINGTRKYHLRDHAYVNNENKIVSSYIASGSMIEDTRRMQHRDFPEADESADQDIFIIDLVHDYDHWRNRSNEGYEEASFDNIIDSDTVMNLRLAPSVMVARHLKTLLVPVRDSDEILQFRKGLGNIRATHKYLEEPDACVHDEVMTENQDYNKETFGECSEPLFQPEVIQFSAPIASDQFNAIQDNPFGLIGTPDYKGFIKEVSVKLKSCEAHIRMYRYE